LLEQAGKRKQLKEKDLVGRYRKPWNTTDAAGGYLD
jgi:hypothetical protein